MELLLILLDDMFFAAIPAVGFALLFNVPQNALKYCALLGASRTRLSQAIATHAGYAVGIRHFFCRQLDRLYRGLLVTTLFGASQGIHRSGDYPDDPRRVRLQSHDRSCANPPYRLF
jgi:hypothetical protein